VIKLTKEELEIVENALRTAYLELRTLEEQLDWFSSDSVEGIEESLQILGYME
jgi:hypothetical protein